MSDTVDVAGSAMPTVGLGLWKIPPAETSGIVREAIGMGYRHLDSAADYGNEIEAGKGIAAALKAKACTRDQLWVTSKLWNTYHHPQHVRAACEKSLSDLGLDYLDLYLVHFPISLKFVPMAKRYPPEWLYDPSAPQPQMVLDPVPLADTWGAMEQLVEAGLVRHIGVCNYNAALLHDLMAYARIKPDMLQVESHPYLTQEKLLRTAASYAIPFTAFSPLGALSYVPLDMATPQDSVLLQPSVLAAAARVERTPAQVVLRWGVQRGTAVIPKSMHKGRLAENLQLFDFALSDEEMLEISALNANRRFNDPGVFCESAFNRFHAIYD